MEQQELSSIAGENVNWYNHFGWQFGWFLTNYIYLTLSPSNHTPWYLSKGVENLCPHKNLHMDIYSSSTYNYQTWKEPRCRCGKSRQWSITQQFKKKIYQIKKRHRGTLNAHYWEKEATIIKDCILYDSNSIIFWKRQN